MNKLQEEGDRLVEMKHPASALIQVRPAQPSPRSKADVMDEDRH